ncbi:MAG: hypothetical protein HQL64_03465 [Magnetococcales bacterium]|nr:hypothetical protein [Magnetococcales bacterium]
MNIQKQMDHWRNGSDEDLDAAEIMISAGKLRHGLFFPEILQQVREVQEWLRKRL